MLFFPQERKEKTDNPPPVPISSSICGSTMTSASIGSGVGRPRCIPQASATYTECVISRHFLCRPAWSVFASWFRIFADNRGMVTFRNNGLWFRLWECLLVGTFPHLFHPCVNFSHLCHPSWMDGQVVVFSLSPHVPCSVTCPMQVHIYGVPVSLPLQLHLILFWHTASLP